MKCEPTLLGELTVLEPMLGIWDEIVQYQPAILTPDGQTATSLTTKSSELAGRFLYMSGKWQPPGTDFLNVITYDSNAKEFRMWYFDSTGAFSPAPMCGQWNPQTQILTWRSLDEQGNDSVGTHSIVSMDRNEWTMVTKTSGGDLLMSAHGVLNRRSV